MSINSADSSSIIVTFRVAVETKIGEFVCVTGNVRELGNWVFNKALKLDKEEHELQEIWQRKMLLTVDKSFQYRYLVCSRLKCSDDYVRDNIIVTRWETNVKPRVFQIAEINKSESEIQCGLDEFGYYDKKCSVRRGWLTGQTEIQLRFSPGAFTTLWQTECTDHAGQICAIKCKAVDQRQTYGSEESGSMSRTYFSSVNAHVLNQVDCIPNVQNDTDYVYTTNETTIFRLQSFEPEYLGFQLDFYAKPSSDNQSLQHVGNCYILPLPLENSIGVQKSCVYGIHHKLIGHVTVNYLIVKPLSNYQTDMEVSYQTHWNDKDGTVDIGHRGMGASSYVQPPLKENTIASFISAASYVWGPHDLCKGPQEENWPSGAKFVEFDVQLTKDSKPVLFHDYSVYLKKNDQETFFKISVKDLSFKQLHTLKLYDSVEVKYGIHSEFLDDDNPDHQLFSTLENCFNSVDKQLGFNIEVKFPLLQQNGVHEQEHYFDANVFVDVILRVILDCASSRQVILSCFNPDICILLQMKQNKYPVLYLTMGITERYVPYVDERTHSIEAAINFAKSEQLLGIVALTDLLFQDLEILKKLKKENLVVFCWGELNNSRTTIKNLKTLGIDGIVYDRIDLHGPNAKDRLAD